MRNIASGLDVRGRLPNRRRSSSSGMVALEKLQSYFSIDARIHEQAGDILGQVHDLEAPRTQYAYFSLEEQEVVRVRWHKKVLPPHSARRTSRAWPASRTLYTLNLSSPAEGGSTSSWRNTLSSYIRPAVRGGSRGIWAGLLTPFLCFHTTRVRPACRPALKKCTCRS